MRKDIITVQKHLDPDLLASWEIYNRKEVTEMVRKGIIFFLATMFLAAGSQVFAGDWSADTMKKIEELKIMSRDKKDMAENMPNVTKITADELKSWLDQKKKFVLLDNRLAADYEKEHLAGAVRLSPDDLLEKGRKAADFLNKDDTIVFY